MTLLALVSLSLAGDSACPAPYSQVGSSCLWTSGNIANWATATSTCQGIAGHIPMIKTSEKQSELVTFVESQPHVSGNYNPH